MSFRYRSWDDSSVNSENKPEQSISQQTGTVELSLEDKNN